MLHEEIIKLAREAGMTVIDDQFSLLPFLLRFATLVAEKEPSAGGIIFAVEQAIRNGDCPWEIEAAFDAYESDRQAIHARNNTSNS